MLGEAVIPPNKGAGRVYTTQSLLTGDSEFFILCGSICEKDGIVMGLECGERQIVAEVDVADKVEAGRGCDLGEFIFAILGLNVSLRSSYILRMFNDHDLCCCCAPLLRDDLGLHHNEPIQMAPVAFHTYRRLHLDVCSVDAMRHRILQDRSPQSRCGLVEQFDRYDCSDGAPRTRLSALE